MNRGSYFTLEYDFPQVVILPVVEEDSVIMVRVLRSLMDDAPLELPAGGANPGETPLKAVMRELREETGIGIDDPSRFHTVLPLAEMPGRMPVLLSVFRIDLSKTEWENRGAHDAEIASVHLLSRDILRQKILSGEIYLSSPVAILSRFLLQRDS